MLASVVASALVSVLLAVSEVQAAKSSVTCSNTLHFAENKEGHDPCEVWAEMRDICDSSSSSDVTSLSSGYGVYSAPSASSSTADCDCNLEAYNSMAACTLCQGTTYKWPTVSTWKAGCPSFDTSLLYSAARQHDAAEVSDISMNLPPSVQFYRPNVTWEPKAACRMSFSDWDECDAKFGTLAANDDDSGPTARPSHRPSSSSDFNIYDEVDLKTLWIIAAICVAIPALTSIIALIVCCVRNKNRKKFYGPLAAYYRSGGAPPPTAFNQGGLLAGHYQAQSATLQGHHHKYASVSSDLPQYDRQQFTAQAYDPPKPFAGEAYDPPQQKFPSQPYQQYQYDYPYKA